jgi:signal transduction histidine kinase
MRPAATILLVEDDQSLLDGIRDLLEVAELGYDIRVLTAGNGRAGLAVMAESVPNLIISDIMMPQMDGFEFLSHVRQIPAWVHIPLIFLTARGSKQEIFEGRLSGAELYVTKPFDNDELLQLVKGQLDRTFQLQLVRQERLDKLKRTILQLLNHEFRTPLTYVTAYYEMLAEGLVGHESENLQEYLRGIQAGCERMSRLVEDLILVMELRTGEARARHDQRARPLDDIGELLREAARQAAPLAQSKAIAIREEIEPSLPAVYGDRHSLAVIFHHLINNAVKFTAYRRDDRGVVHLIAEGHGDGVRITVADNGIGFPDQVKSQIFDLFFQYNREQLEQQGSGSGLAIVRGLVELHQGRIEVESEPGCGSTFAVLLPAYHPDDAPGHGAGGKPGKAATVLVVEDDHYLLYGLRELLEICDVGYHFRVLTASNGRLGLEVLARDQPDLIISDIMMPEMDGYEFLSEVRRNPAWLHIPFIFLTARGERHDIYRGWRSGVAEYITKPYDSDQLLELVVTQLNRHMQVQGAFNQDFEGLKRSILALLQPEFRLPLDIVSRYSQKLAHDLEEAETDEEVMESLRNIQAGSSRLSMLVKDFINLAELRTGEAVTSFRLQSRPLNAGALLSEVGAVLQEEGQLERLKVGFAIEPELPMVLAHDRALSDVYIACASSRWG